MLTTLLLGVVLAICAKVLDNTTFTVDSGNSNANSTSNPDSFSLTKVSPKYGAQSAFNKRFDNNEGKNSKKDVANYMKKMKQETEAPMNSALADALAKLNLK